MYPYPPYAPPYGPAPAPPRPPRTPQGFRWFLITLLVYVILLVLALVGALALYAMVGSLTANPDPARLTSSAVPAVTLILLVGLVGFFVIALFVVSFAFLFGGRNEFGPTQARNMRLSLYLLVAALVTAAASSSANLVFALAEVRTLTGNVQQVDPGAYYLAVAAQGIFGVVVAALIAGMLVLSVRALARPKHQLLLYAAAGLGTATPGIVSALTLVQLPGYLALVQAYLDAQSPGLRVSVPSLDPSFGLPMAVGAALGLVTFALYLLVFRDVSMRLRSGELAPILPPAAQLPPWAQGPMPAYPGTPAYPMPTYPYAPPTPPPRGPAP